MCTLHVLTFGSCNLSLGGAFLTLQEFEFSLFIGHTYMPPVPAAKPALLVTLSNWLAHYHIFLLCTHIIPNVSNDVQPRKITPGDGTFHCVTAALLPG